MKTIRVVAAVIKAVDEQGKEILFATQRGYGDMKGGWEFPGGKIEPGETPQEALKREIQEELDTKIKVGSLIDTIEYDYAKVTYLENRESIDELVKMFLVDNYFDYFVRDSKILSEMYDCKDVDSISFIEEFKNELSNYMGMEINTLNKAKSLVKRVNMPSYGRSIIKINY